MASLTAHSSPAAKQGANADANKVVNIIKETIEASLIKKEEIDHIRFDELKAGLETIAARMAAFENMAGSKSKPGRVVKVAVANGVTKTKTPADSTALPANNMLWFKQQWAQSPGFRELWSRKIGLEAVEAQYALVRADGKTAPDKVENKVAASLWSTVSNPDKEQLKKELKELRNQAKANNSTAVATTAGLGLELDE